MQIVGIFNILSGNFNQNNFVTRAVDNKKWKKKWWTRWNEN